MKTQVSVTRVILSILQTSCEPFRVFKVGISFAYIIRLGDRFCLVITFAVVLGPSRLQFRGFLNYELRVARYKSVKFGRKGLITPGNYDKVLCLLDTAKNN